MPQLSPGKLPELLSRRPVAAAFFLHGEEDHLREEAAALIVDAFLDPTTRDFNYDQLRGGDVQADTLASILATPPMMAEHRVVLLRDAQGLSAKSREVVEAAATAPPSGLVLVLSGQIPAGSKAKFYSTLQRHALSFEFSPVDPLDLPGWLVERAAEVHGAELELDAARAMAAAIGSQLGILASELDKLGAYTSGRRRITLDDVRAVGGYVPRADRWRWFDLVVEKRFGDALALLPELLGSGENGVGLVIGISAQLTRVGLAVVGGREALERELKPHQRWLINRLAPIARAWTLEEVDASLLELLLTDRLLKSASLTDRQAVEELLLRLAERVGPRRHAA